MGGYEWCFLEDADDAVHKELGDARCWACLELLPEIQTQIVSKDLGADRNLSLTTSSGKEDSTKSGTFLYLDKSKKATYLNGYPTLHAYVRSWLIPLFDTSNF